jgi:hypothetical protein
MESCERTESPLWIICSATVLRLCMIVLLNSGTDRLLEIIRAVIVKTKKLEQAFDLMHERNYEYQSRKNEGRGLARGT